MGWTAGARGGVWRDGGLRPFASARIPGSSGISPYRVLGLPRHASEKEIRAKFRELAYRLHPDLNHDAGEEPEIALPGSGKEAGGDGNPTLISMADVVEAYEALMNGGGGTARDSRISSSVEKFTIRELMDDEQHTVVPLVMVMDVLLESGGSGEHASEDAALGAEPNVKTGEAVLRGSMASHAKGRAGPRDGPAANGQDADVNGKADGPTGTLRVHASGFDAVADLKRDLQAQFGSAWGLQGRRLDHENVAIGWELVHDATVLCPNYFLEDYGIETGDTVHAVIRDYTDPKP
eukprot:g5122.t1